jgi:hypothetical protein
MERRQGICPCQWRATSGTLGCRGWRLAHLQSHQSHQSHQNRGRNLADCQGQDLEELKAHLDRHRTTGMRDPDRGDLNSISLTE